jgi:nitrite reductase/ring-hydroxylating ferredoxin subunit
MANAPPAAARATRCVITSDPQALIGYRTNEEWLRLLDQVNAKLVALEGSLDPEQHAQVLDLLQGIDAVHRESLHRLVRLFKEGVVEQVITDPAIHTLFGMYDLLPPEEPGCAKVWDFLGDLPSREEPSLSDAEPPHWSPAPVLHAPKEGEALLCRMEEGTILLAHAGGALHALDAACPRHGALMMGGRVSGVSWICPLGPGCVYDLRDGARLGGGAPLACHPVRTDGAGRILVGFGIPHAPQKPAF